MTASEKLTKERAIEIGGKIVELREAQNWTQADLCEVSEIHQSVLSRIEKGKHPPTMIRLYEIADSLGVHPGKLLPPFT